LSSDNDPLFRYQQWNANLRILEVEQVKTIPYAPMSHPFVERLIGTIRREYLDQVPFWTTRDLERKLLLYKEYYNRYRPHQGLDGALPDPQYERVQRKRPRLDTFQWRNYCRGLYQLPEVA
jgi:putative transposase